MKKLLLMSIVIILVGGVLGAQNIGGTPDPWLFGMDTGERWQVGMFFRMAVNPYGFNPETPFSLSSSATFGYRWTSIFETNITAGYDFINKAPILSANGLFTVVTLSSYTTLRLSLGPQGSFVFGDPIASSIFGVIRADNTFLTIPLNLFLEMGAGFSFISDGPVIQLGLGLTYIF